MPKFICTERCFTNRVVERGEIIFYPEKEDINVGVRGFFEPAPTADQIEAMEHADITEKSKRATCKTELDQMGVAYDGRASLAKLQSMLAIARRDSGDKVEKPLSKMLKDELQKKAEGLELEFTEDTTKTELQEMIIERIKQDG